MNRTTAAVLGTVAVLAVAAYFVFRGRADEPGPGAATTFAVVERRDLEVAAEAAGLVEPVRVVEVKSRAGGEVLEVTVETGDAVERGALLAAIDPRDVANDFAQAEADLASARVGAQIAEAQIERMKRLRAEGVVSDVEVDSATESAAFARAAVLRADTNLGLRRERLGDVVIRAPIAGTVIERLVEPGQIIASATGNVSGGSSLFKMADLAEMRVRAKIDETDIGRLRAGQTARLSVEAHPGRSFFGQVEKIEPAAVVEQNVTLFPVLIRLDNRDGLLLPGMNAEVAIEIARRENVLVVPNSAIVGLREVASAATTLGLDPEAVRAVLRPSMRPDLNPEANGEQAPARDRTDSGGGRERRSGRRDTAGATEGGPRPGMVFVVGADGAPEPRRVLIGLSDWEFTEVLEGLAEGDRVVQVSIAQMQSQQRAAEDRFRARSGGVVPGTGAPSGGRGR